jgi:hypothetical protein
MFGSSYTGVSIGDRFWDRATWEYKFVIWPKQCEISNKRIWLKCAYKGTRMITGPGEPVFEYRWLTNESFLFARLKGII